jgi:hypothetical protein
MARRIGSMCGIRFRSTASRQLLKPAQRWRLDDIPETRRFLFAGGAGPSLEPRTPSLSLAVAYTMECGRMDGFQKEEVLGASKNKVTAMD